MAITERITGNQKISGFVDIYNRNNEKLEDIISGNTSNIETIFDRLSDIKKDVGNYCKDYIDENFKGQVETIVKDTLNVDELVKSLTEEFSQKIDTQVDELKKDIDKKIEDNIEVVQSKLLELDDLKENTIQPLVDKMTVSVEAFKYENEKIREDWYDAKEELEEKIRTGDNKLRGEILHLEEEIQYVNGDTFIERLKKIDDEIAKISETLNGDKDGNGGIEAKIKELDERCPDLGELDDKYRSHIMGCVEHLLREWGYIPFDSNDPILWSDIFCENEHMFEENSNNTNFDNQLPLSQYDYCGLKGIGDNKIAIKGEKEYTGNDNVRISKIKANGVEDCHLWFNKGGYAEFITFPIYLYGAKKLELTYTQANVDSETKVYYSLISEKDGFVEVGKGFKCTDTNKNAEFTIDISEYNPSPDAKPKKIWLKITNEGKTEYTKNTRIDNIVLKGLE